MAYVHHSARNSDQASPLPLSHRNESAFPQGLVLQQQYADPQSREPGSPASPKSLGSPKRTKGLKRDNPHRVSEHEYLTRTEPERYSPYSSPTRSRPPKSFLQYNPLAHDVGLVNRDDSKRIWNDSKLLRFGIHKANTGRPYVSREDWVDPLRGTNPTRRVASGYFTDKTKMRPKQIDRPFGYKRAPVQAVDLAEKITSIDPRNPNAAPQDVPVFRRLPLTPLLEEVEAKLRDHGCGSLVDVRFASDEAISEILRSIGLSGTQRMTVLWELRRSFPSTAESIPQESAPQQVYQYQQQQRPAVAPRESIDRSHQSSFSAAVGSPRSPARTPQEKYPGIVAPTTGSPLSPMQGRGSQIQYQR